MKIYKMFFISILLVICWSLNISNLNQVSAINSAQLYTSVPNDYYLYLEEDDDGDDFSFIQDVKSNQTNFFSSIKWLKYLGIMCLNFSFIFLLYSIYLCSINKSHSKNKFVFLDLSGKRFLKIKIITSTFGLIFMIIIPFLIWLFDIFKNNDLIRILNCFLYFKTDNIWTSTLMHYYKDLFYFVFYLINSFVDFFLIILIPIIFIRLILLFCFSYKNRKKEKIYDKNYKPFVSVIIAAYNEDKVICETIESILHNIYDKFEIIIVNDGSTDNTAKIINSKYSHNSDILIINKQNSGKTDSINQGIRAAKGEIIVCIDADTIIHKDAIKLMVRHFANSKIAAVAGHLKVANHNNMLTKWQKVEYIIGINLEKRAFEKFNGIVIVPGAIGAWRHEDIKKHGYFKDDTLAEDTDLTLSFLSDNKKIIFEDKAYAYTEVPGSLKNLKKQRFRWSYGNLQCIWKNRKKIFKSKNQGLRYIAFPNFWIVQFLLPLFNLFLSASIIYSIINGLNCNLMLISYLIFIICDYIIAIYAFNVSKENKKLILSLFFQIIFYKFFTSFIVFKSILFALKGERAGWQKFEREAI